VSGPNFSRGESGRLGGADLQIGARKSEKELKGAVGHPHKKPTQKPALGRAGWAADFSDLRRQKPPPPPCTFDPLITEQPNIVGGQGGNQKDGIHGWKKGTGWGHAQPPGQEAGQEKNGRFMGRGLGGTRRGHQHRWPLGSQLGGQRSMPCQRDVHTCNGRASVMVVEKNGSTREGPVFF